MCAGEMQLRVVSMSGDALAVLKVRPNTYGYQLKLMLVDTCMVPYDLQQVIIEQEVLKDGQKLSAFVREDELLTVTLVTKQVAYAFASGCWQAVCATGEGPEVLRQDALGEGVVVGGRNFEIAKEFGTLPIRGHASIWASWSSLVTLADVVVLGLHLEVPRKALSSCTIGLTTPQNLQRLRGGSSVEQVCSEWKLGSFIAFTPPFVGPDAASTPATVRCGTEAIRQDCQSTMFFPFYDSESDKCADIFIAFDRTKRQVAVTLGLLSIQASCGASLTRTNVQEEFWPRADEELVPFLAIKSQEFGGFQDVSADNFPVRVKALHESTLCSLPGFKDLL
eukprot:TRINITY_DN72948_c0_g1_i2.p1 TRINITY_DN72948_c0_g1~~TRINITY_DN72948_c0_g1_i2.p1  ORF type:complete len:336 (+),score=34.09 TRINITY_DN72948_c0_g1_i2:96-1103(+)